MRYVSWAAFYEGPSDALYFDILLPRLIRDLIAREGKELVEVPDVPSVKLGGAGRSVEAIAKEACESRDAFDLVFIHADTGGRAVECTLADRADAYCAALRELCSWPTIRCITMSPRHETEAWLLSDGNAVTSALGYRGSPSEIGIPESAQAAERLVDPKRVLRDATELVAGRRRAQAIDRLFPAVAQRQRLEVLRRSRSFIQCESKLRECLIDIGCI